MKFRLRSLLLSITLICVFLATAHFWAVYAAIDDKVVIFYPRCFLKLAGVSHNQNVNIWGEEVRIWGDRFDTRCYLLAVYSPNHREIVGCRTIFGWSWFEVRTDEKGTLTVCRRLNGHE